MKNLTTTGLDLRGILLRERKAILCLANKLEPMGKIIDSMIHPSVKIATTAVQ